MIEWSEIFRNLSYFTVAVGAIVWLAKRIATYTIDKSLKEYESELQKKLTEYEKKLDYSLRKESIYHDILLRKIAKLYKLIRILHRDMEILTAKVKMIPGDEEEAKKLENAQIQNAGNSYNDFLEFYTINKIYFSSDVCKMVEALREGYFDSYWDYTAKNRFGFTDFKLNFKNAVAASEKIQKDVKPLLEKLEADVRSTVMGRK